MKHILKIITLLGITSLMIACVDEDEVTPEDRFERNLQSIQAFLTDNQLTGYDSTESGIYYLIEQQGNAAKPLLGDTVIVNYTAMTLGSSIENAAFGKAYGNVIYSTFFDEDSIRVNVGQVVNVPNAITLGWEEALQLMEVNSKMVFFFPSNLGYGQRGFPPLVEEDQVLVYEIELLEIRPAF